MANGRAGGVGAAKKTRIHGPVRPRCRAGRRSGGNTEKNACVSNGVTGNPRKRISIAGKTIFKIAAVLTHRHRIFTLASAAQLIPKFGLPSDEVRVVAST